MTAMVWPGKKMDRTRILSSALELKCKDKRHGMTQEKAVQPTGRQEEKKDMPQI